MRLGRLCLGSPYTRCLCAVLLWFCLLAHPVPAQQNIPNSNTTVVLQTQYPGQSVFAVQAPILINTPMDGISGNNSQNWTVTNLGTITAGNNVAGRYSGIFLGGAAAGASRVVNAGTITSTATVSSGASGVRFSRGGSVSNQGTIEGLDGVHADGGLLTVENTGTIRSNIGSGSGVYSGGGANVYNYAGGLIQSNNYGINLNGYGVNALVDNSGTITANNGGVNFYNGITFALINRPTGIISSVNSAVSSSGTQGYMINYGSLSSSAANAATVFFDEAQDNIVVNAGSVTASGGGSVGIRTGSNESGAVIYNLGNVTSAGGTAIQIGGSNSLLVLGTSAYLPRVGLTVTGPGSSLNGNAVSTGANNSVLLTDSGTENNSLIGFNSLTMDGANWTLSAPLTVNTLHVQSGTLDLSGSPLTLPGSPSGSGSLLVDVGATLNAGAISMPGANARALFGGTATIGSVSVEAGSLFRLDDKSARVTVTPGSALTLAPGARFGVTVSRDESQHAILYADSFTPPEGVILDTRVHLPSGSTAGLSSLPGGNDFTFSGVVQTVNPVAIPHSMQFADNAMVTAGMFVNSGNPNFADLRVAVRTINAVFGPNLEAADVWRLTDLPGTAQRDWLDDIYQTGTLADATRHFFELLQGSPLLATQDARRADWRALTSAVRGRSPDSAARGRSPDGTARGRSADGLGRDDTAQPEGAVIWGDIRQDWSTQRSDSGQNLPGYTYTPTRVFVGLEHHAPQWLAGAAVQYLDGHLSAAGGDVDTHSQGGLLALYGEYRIQGWYLAAGAQAGYVWNTSETDYRAWGGTVQSSYGSRLWGANGEIGYRFRLGGAGSGEAAGETAGEAFGDAPGKTVGDTVGDWGISPYVGIEAGSFRQSGFTESGNTSLNRRFSSSDYTVTEVPVGLRLYKDFQFGPTPGPSPGPTSGSTRDAAPGSSPGSAPGSTPGPSTLRLFSDIAYAYNFGDTVSHAQARFTGEGSPSWTLKGQDADRHALRFSAGLAARMGEHVSLELSYALEARGRYTGQGLRFGLAMNF